MKKIFTVVAAMLLTVGATMAQESYTRLQVSYITNTLSNIDEDAIAPKGFALGGVLGLPVSDNLPIYLEPGLNISWSHSAKDLKELGCKIAEEKFSYMNVAVPVNGVYKFELNDKVAFSGHAGLNFKVNFMAKEHSKTFDPVSGKETSKYDCSWISKDDMGDRENRANIFQLGGQVGVGVHLGQTYIGWQFQTDFMKFQQEDVDGADKHKWHTQYITIGYTL